MKKVTGFISLALACTMALSANIFAAEAKNPEDYTGNLVVYSPHDADPLAAGVALFEEAYPNIKVAVVAAGTGELCQRIVAESANPQGDVLWGGGADTLAAYKEYFSPYVCANDDVISASFKDPDQFLADRDRHIKSTIFNMLISQAH